MRNGVRVERAQSTSKYGAITNVATGANNPVGSADCQKVTGPSLVARASLPAETIPLQSDASIMMSLINSPSWRVSEVGHTGMDDEARLLYRVQPEPQTNTNEITP
jgi:hypothetical protein